MLLAALAMGAQGAVGSTYGYMAPIYNNIITSYNNRHLDKARTYQLVANQFIHLLNKYGGGTGKTFMKAIGLNMGKHRLPVSSLSPQQEELFYQELEKLDFQKYCNKL